MGAFKQRLVGLAAGIYFRLKGSPLAQREIMTGESGEIEEETPALLRRAAAEGAVLLKNDGVLPLSGKIALFGRVQNDTFYSGYGSGGNVLKPYRVSIAEGLERAGVPLVSSLAEAYRAYSEEHPVRYGGWGEWPRSYPEMPLPRELVLRAREETDTAVVVIGRAAGEDMDHAETEGSYLLTQEERGMLALVAEHFSRAAVVLNTGSIIDLSWTEQYPSLAVLLLFQGGMETGNACADVLTGKVCPSGKLADTVARAYADYPSAEHFAGARRIEYSEDIFVGYRHFETKARERVLFPFGFGLSYTSFRTDAHWENGEVIFSVKNAGSAAGREVVQVYVQKPCNGIGQPARELVAFHKTKLLGAGEEEHGRIALCVRDFASYLPERDAFVRLAGTYRIFAGTDVRSAAEIACMEFGECVAERAPRLLHAVPPAPELPAPAATCTFADVKEGRATAEAFVAQLSDGELEALAYGALKMDSPLGAAGNAGVLGGTTEGLRARGVPAITMTDGPSGIRLKRTSSLLPVAALLACTFDPDLMEEVYAAVGREMRARGSDVLLAPAMNIHRDPLCGRNFEYYSEDPYLSGKLAAAAVRGLQREGVSACPKHFACNNREYERNVSDSVLSERALREIYLRGFEICVKEGHPRFLMTSYNKINGVYAHYNAALINGVLRGEWGFGGCVVTDWWMKKGSCPDAGKRKNNAARVHAGVNVLMPGGGYLGKRYQHGGLLHGLGKKGRLTRGELQKNACEVIRALAAHCKGE